MENAAKALIMAGGILMTLLILTLLVVSYDNIAMYFSSESQSNREEQLTKFNLEYESYNHKNLRGTEILSLLAKADDYNTMKSDYEGSSAGYMPIKITINIPDSTLFKFDADDSLKIESIYKDDDYSKILKIKSECLKELSDLIQNENAIITDSIIETLVGAIGAICDDDIENLNDEGNTNDIYKRRDIRKRNELIKNVFMIDESRIRVGEFWSNNKEKIQKYTKQYYQYVQLKRSYFDCKKVEYDKNTGRVKSMTFEFVKIGE